jgi:hypothetical protein
MKDCSNTDCKQQNPQSLDSFTKDKLSYYCKNCCNDFQSNYRKNNKKYQKEYHMRKKYNLSLEDYNKMLAEQEHKCKLCGIDEVYSGKKGLVVDHNHKTGQIRSLLCGNCNTALGSFKENEKIILNAVDYLRSYSLISTQSNIISFKK